MSARLFVTISLGALLFAACDKKKDEGASPATSATVASASSSGATVAANATASATASATTGATTGAKSSAPLADKDIPVKADFAGEVRKQITKANYKAELDKAEQALGKP